ncbi:MAG TPA: hypothetical protein VK742_21685 [Candidatus Sulfotelmatobacter sp.]|nr:hypothetical protein [Candidatus Sulfotelmatobacter sp.]
MDNSIVRGDEAADGRRQLVELREALQQLHKTLLASERMSYETSFGVTLSPYQFLQLLTNDPWFTWLAPVTQLLADLDVRLDDKKSLTVADVQLLSRRAKLLLTPTETGEGFSRQYDEVLQRDPDVLFGHVVMAKLLRAHSEKGIAE